MRKMIVVTMVVCILALTGCQKKEAPVATLEPEGVETILTENILVESIEVEEILVEDIEVRPIEVKTIN